jgi:hypothetical protein
MKIVKSRDKIEKKKLLTNKSVCPDTNHPACYAPGIYAITIITVSEGVPIALALSPHT